MSTCTVIARNYLAPARVLARSYAHCHGGERLQVLILDDVAGAIGSEDEPFDVLGPGDLPLDRAEFWRMAACYGVLELATALKPWLLQALLSRGDESVVYLDPDIVVFDSLAGLREAAHASPNGIALTPHRVTPMPDDELRPSESELLRSGVFNLGFIAVTSAALPFLEWWQNRLRRDCIVAPETGLFVDQRFIDEVPALWSPTVVRDSGYNVAYWNADERRLRNVDGVITAAGQPLRFVHFSGYDPDTPHVLSRNTGDIPRVLLSEHPVLRELAARYGDELEHNNRRDAEKIEYGFDHASNGYRIDRRSRHRYRDALKSAEHHNLVEPPNPYVDGDAFVAWLRSPAIGRPPRVSRYLESIWMDRPDLKAVFPNLRDPDKFLEWVRLYGASDGGVPPEMLPDDYANETPPPDLGSIRAANGEPTGRPNGVNVVGYLAAESGVGEGARLLVSALRAGRVAHSLVGYTETVARQQDPFGAHESGQALHDVNVVCINADEMVRFVHGPGRSLFDGRPTVGMWAWEVEAFPADMAEAARYVDEVWMGSDHASAAVRAGVRGIGLDVPVYTFQLPIVPPEPSNIDRAALDLPPDAFVFLFAFSFHSVVERKDPFALIEAFCTAFEPNEGPVLVIKTIHGDHNRLDLERLHAATRGRTDILVRDGVVPRDVHAGLVHACDAYVSLHRAEGFGLTTAEAMALGKPVIGTAYSGTLENMTPANSWLVPYRLVAVGEGSEPYPPDARWAEPDIAHAARAMREVVDNPTEAAKRGARAARDMVELHGPATRARFVKERVAALEAAHAKRWGRRDPGAKPTPGDIARRVVARMPTPVQRGARRVARRLLAELRERRTPHPVAPLAPPTPAALEVEPIGTILGPMRVPLDEVVHPWVHHYLTWEEDIAAIIREALPYGGTALDIGAHVGLHTVLMSALAGTDGRVIAVEPSAETRAVLRANLGDRPYTGNVEIIEAAAWDEATTLALTTNPSNSGDTRVAPSPTGTIPAVVLDDWFGDEDRLDLIKIDAQGSDHIALRGLAKTIARCKPVVIVEFDPDDIAAAGHDPSEVAGAYAALGLGVHVLETGDHDLAANDLVDLARRTGDGFVTLVLGRR